MNYNEIQDIIERLGEINQGTISVTDQIAVMQAYMKFATEVKPIVAKYTSTPGKSLEGINFLFKFD